MKDALKTRPETGHGEEAAIRRKLAYAYRILARLGLDDHTYTHLSARDAAGSGFFIYPFGLRFGEVTADNLIHASLDGDIVSGSEYQYNRTGYVIHGAIYRKRADINAVFHLHTPEISAVSACREGLLPLSQWALHFYNRISYHAYDSLALSPQQGEAMLEDLGRNFTMLLRNHGSVTCGRTVEEAMFYTHHLQQACRTQCLALAMNRELIIPPSDVCERAARDLLGFEKDLGARDWQAWMRWVDSEK
jgi:ribulose-5-phosphate 4-epimerase/fuculose-1-phosphate aldolase